MLEQHLMEEATYQKMTEEEVHNFVEEFLEQAKSLILFKYDKYLSDTQYQEFLVTVLTKPFKCSYM